MAISLCELMAQVYRKLVECAAAGASKAVLEAVARSDALLEEHFFSPAAKCADALARVAMRSSLSRMEPLFAQVWGQGGDAVDDSERSIKPSIGLS